MTTDSPPTIAHVINSLEGGGTERTLVALLRAFDPDRFRHVVLTLRSAGNLTDRLPDHVAVRPLNQRGRSRITGIVLARETHRRRAALIHARNTGCWNDAVVAAVLNHRTRLTLGFHGLETQEGFGARQRRTARWALRSGAVFTAVSHAGQRQLQEQASIPPDRVRVLHNGVDVDRYRPRDTVTRRRIRAAMGYHPDDFVVGIVGSLTPVKGHHTLIQAVALAARTLPHLRLLIVGEGPLREDLGRQVHDEGVTNHITFAGFRDDIPELAAGMDAYACSSEFEGMNNALLEAMACRLPVVATDVGENAAMVRHDREGLIIPPRNPDSMAKAVIRLANDTGLRNRYAEAARQRARGYDFTKSVSAYEQYYESLIGGSDRQISAPRPVSSGNTSAR